jgi:hypothetical protein
MDYILFCANWKITDMKDAVEHLRDHEKLYFTVTFEIKKERFHFPMTGFVHISGPRGAHKVTHKVTHAVRIERILPFSREHYEGPGVEAFKPRKWLQEWQDNTNKVRDEPLKWKYTLVITAIERFECDTYSLQKTDDGKPVRPTQNYIRIRRPSGWSDLKP